MRRIVSRPMVRGEGGGGVSCLCVIKSAMVKNEKRSDEVFVSVKCCGVVHLFVYFITRTGKDIVLC